MLWERKIPGDNFRRADKIKRGRRQRRHVQRLANVAGSIGAFGVFVKETSARDKIQQRGTSQQCQRPAHNRPSNHESQAIHRPEFTLALRLYQVEPRCFKNNTAGPVFLDPATIPA